MKESELDLMLKNYTEEEKQEVYAKAESMDNLLKAMVALESSYDDDGSKDIDTPKKVKAMTNGGW